MINPYNNVIWSNDYRVCSVSHAHGRSEKAFRNGLTGGVVHFALSNYYPSEPYAPLEDFFENVPDGIIGSKNAEHHGFNVARCHLNGIGCTLVSGNPKGVSPVGMASLGISAWQNAIDAILKTILYQDAGGVTINHPTWTGLSASLVKRMLDRDSRVLGIEIVNEAGYYEEYKDRKDMSLPYALELWDQILMTGRRCWGVCVPDHGLERSSRWTGRNILLTKEMTEYACLKAYRDGNFYSKIYDSNLDFESIEFNNGTLSVNTVNADQITIIIDNEKIVVNGNAASAVIPTNAIYCRVEASKQYAWENEEGNIQSVTDKVFSNPIIFKQYIPAKQSSSEEIIQTIFDC